jgi:hypothetical protein
MPQDKHLSLAKLASYVGNPGSAAWVGDYPIPNTISIPIRKSTLFRVHPKLHGKFDVVFLIEDSLENLGEEWEAFLDESLRLLNSRGVALIKLQQTSQVNLINVKRFLGRSRTAKITLIDQWQSETDQVYLILEVERYLFAEYSQKSWTFGIISDGKRMDNIFKSIESIKKLEADIEIIVVGPQFPHIDVKNIIFEGDSLARIAEKKNILALAATGSNLCIMHDRYLIHEDFLKGWDSYGYDFDFCGISQSTLQGSIYPSLVALPVKNEKWQSPVYWRDGHYADGNYVNGGLFVVKTALMREIGLNPLMLHNEAEDVEFSWTLRYHGVSTRMNLFSKATTIHGESIGGFTPISNRRTGLRLRIRNSDQLYRIYLHLPIKIRNNSLTKRVKNWLKKCISG